MEDEKNGGLTADEVLEGADAFLEGRTNDPAVAKLLGAADILAADDITTERLSVPEWGGDVIVKTLNGHDRDKFETDMMEGRGNNRRMNLANFRSRLVALSLVDEKGEKLFAPQQVDQLGKKSAAALQRVYNVAARLSGFSDDEVEQLTQDLGKDQNSEPGIALP